MNRLRRLYLNISSPSEMKFCCSDFKSAYYLKNEECPNIRVVKFVSHVLFHNYDEICRGDKTIKIKKYRPNIKFWLTGGYKNFSDNYGSIPLIYCPYCGKHLSSFYRNDKYANEIEGITFPIVCKKR